LQRERGNLKNVPGAELKGADQQYLRDIRVDVLSAFQWDIMIPHRSYEFARGALLECEGARSIAKLTMSDSPSLIFTQKNLLESTVVDSSGALHYTTTTTTGLRGRKVTTITGANAVGEINWRDQTFAIGDVCRGWDALRSRVGVGSGGCVLMFFKCCSKLII
jgi:hypothetical protein